MLIDRVFPPAVLARGEKHARSYYGLHPEYDLMWGMFDSWDGLAYVATDGLIAWRSEDLARFVQANGGKEMGWAGASRVLGRSVGPRIEKPRIASNHRALAEVRCLDIRAVVGEKDWVYLCKSKSEVTADDFSVVYAAVINVK